METQRLRVGLVEAVRSATHLAKGNKHKEAIEKVDEAIVTIGKSSVKDSDYVKGLQKVCITPLLSSHLIQ